MSQHTMSDIMEVRFFAVSTTHSHVIHFKSWHSDAIEYAYTGDCARLHHMGNLRTQVTTLAGNTASASVMQAEVLRLSRGQTQKHGGAQFGELSLLTVWVRFVEGQAKGRPLLKGMPEAYTEECDDFVKEVNPMDKLNQKQTIPFLRQPSLDEITVANMAMPDDMAVEMQVQVQYRVHIHIHVSCIICIICIICRALHRWARQLCLSARYRSYLSTLSRLSLPPSL